MPDDEQPPEELGRPTWRDRIAVSQTGGGFAYVPGRILVRGAAARTRALESLGRGGSSDEGGDGAASWEPIDDVPDPLALVELLRAEGLDGSPEHVFFAHPCDPCAGLPHPSVLADPFRSHAVGANPFRSHPYRSHPYRSHEAPTSSAVPAAHRAWPARALAGTGSPPSIVVLDTGLAGGTENGAVNADGQRPALLNPAGAAAARISGVADHADGTITLLNGQVFTPDGYLNPVAGHGTFIAGVIEQLAPGCTIRVEHVIEPLGDGRELDIVDRLQKEARRTSGRADIISMSFGGPVWDHAPALRAAIAEARLAGIVLVASAGNDGVSTHQYPAAFDSVVAVGAVGPDGPPEWTNYGDWVDACAPGVDLVSAFFAKFDGAFPMMNATDIDRFAEWATWSGTSFSTPVVVAALAREMVAGPCSAKEAVERVVRAPHLLRLPCLGTVVNV